MILHGNPGKITGRSRDFTIILKLHELQYVRDVYGLELGFSFMNQDWNLQLNPSKSPLYWRLKSFSI